MKYNYRKRRFSEKYDKKIFLFSTVLLIMLVSALGVFFFKPGITGFAIYQWSSQTDFSSGTYNNTEFSTDHIQV